MISGKSESPRVSRVPVSDRPCLRKVFCFISTFLLCFRFLRPSSTWLLLSLILSFVLPKTSLHFISFFHQEKHCGVTGREGLILVMGNCLDSSAKVDAAHSSRTTTSGNPISSLLLLSHTQITPLLFLDTCLCV